MEIVTKSPKKTKDLGKKLAADLIGNRVKGLGYRDGKASVLALTGELGSGKTTFVQGLAKGLRIEQRIISPTFIIVRKYKISPNTNFYHIDLYRLEENVEFEVKNLGVDDIWDNPENIVAIEWAEKIKKMIPKNSAWVKFENLGGNMRKITVND